MLGERRSNSLFAPTAPAEPERKPEQAEVHDISFEERTGRSLFAENATAPRASELFFAPQEKGVTFAEALSQVQGYLSETYATLITEDNSDAKEQMKRRMARYLQENRIAVDGMTASELVDVLYTEMAEYGFLTKYIFADGIEEIDINSWRDIEIQYSDGHTAKLEEHFDSPEHAANVIRRMLQNSGKVLDNASPIITSRLAKNIRISVIKTPVLDEDAGVAASIRMKKLRKRHSGEGYASKYALSERLVCGECGTLYRRCTWTRNGEKRIVWRCVSRLDYGKKYCHNSPTLDEAPLQQAILAALNTAMADKNSLIRQITDAMETEIIPFPGGTMSLGDIERRLRELEQQFQTLLEKATDDPAAYGGQFKEILDEQTFLKEKRSGILADNNEQAKANQRIQDAAQTLENASPHITEWDESAVRQLVETVKVLSKDEIAITLKGGIEICQKIMY